MAMSQETLAWNDAVRLVLADVDQTVADDFLPATSEMVQELNGALGEGKSLFFVTGGPFARFRPRIGDQIEPRLRHRMIVSHCSGAEVWGYDKNGDVHAKPFYSLYDERLTEAQKRTWRAVVAEAVEAFRLEPQPVQTLDAFRSKFGDNPFAVILEDRGPGITFELVNAHHLTDEQRRQVRARLPHLAEVVDLREPLRAWFAQRLKEEGVAVTPRLAGVFALDLALEGVSKTDSVKRVLANPHIIEHIGLGGVDLSDPKTMEIWGDRFDQTKGTDWLMCAAVDPRVRAIDFRREDPAHFPSGYNIVLWNGKHELQDGALEYLRSRRG
jgi:hypothetical protein